MWHIHITEHSNNANLLLLTLQTQTYFEFSFQVLTLCYNQIEEKLCFQHYQSYLHLNYKIKALYPDHWKACSSTHKCRSKFSQFSVWPTFLFPHLWLVCLSKSFLCCCWQRAVLRALRCQSGRTTARSDQNEGNGFDFLPPFTHQMGESTRTVRLGLT